MFSLNAEMNKGLVFKGFRVSVCKCVIKHLCLWWYSFLIKVHILFHWVYLITSHVNVGSSYEIGDFRYKWGKNSLWDCIVFVKFCVFVSKFSLTLSFTRLNKQLYILSLSSLLFIFGRKLKAPNKHQKTNIRCKSILDDQQE